jgi:hypothetical protein
MADSDVLEQILAVLPDITTLGQENVALKKENALLRGRIARLELELDHLRVQLSSPPVSRRPSRLSPPPAVPDPRPPPTPPPRPPTDPDPDIDEVAFFKPPRGESQLPSAFTIPMFLEQIAATDPHLVGPLVSRVLIQPYQSLCAFQKFAVDLLNTLFAAILTIDRQCDEIRSFAAFLVQFARRVSWIVHEKFVEKISTDADLKAIVAACAKL